MSPVLNFGWPVNSHRMRNFLTAIVVLAAILCPTRAEVIAHWNFNSASPDNNANTGTLQPAIGSGTAVLIGGVTASFTAANGSSDTATDDSNWRISAWPNQNIGNKSHGVGFNVSLAGYRNLRLTWDQRNSNTASKYSRLQYTTNGMDFLDYQVITMPAEAWVHNHSVSFAAVPGVDDNPVFGVRVVTEFERTATGTGLNGYVPSNSGSSYGNNGTLRFDMVTFFAEPIGPNPQPAISLLNYNVWGADKTEWTTNTAQVQAIGRQLAHLTPDIVTLQEIPNIGLAEMPHFVSAHLPGYFLATNRVSDGDKGNLILSRFPIVRSRSNLGRSSLEQWGFDGVFTRDLFEAEIAVPGFSELLHVYSIHLKAFNDPVSGPRRAAEASAVSNYFVTVFLPTNGHRPYVLGGDFNEDIARPRSYEQGAMQRIINDATGLVLTTPRNPLNGDERTWSSRNATPTIRFDYILPGTLLAQHIVTNWIFRTDFLSPTPPGLQSDDSQIATDHLPLLMVFRNPYDVSPVLPLRVNLQLTNETVTLAWDSNPGRHYLVQGSFNLTSWISLSPSIPATSTNTTWQGSTVAGGMFFRVAERP